MFEVAYVGRPRSRVRIHGPRDEKAMMDKLARGREKKLFQAGLTIRRVGAQIREIALEIRRAFDAMMNGGIYPSIERRNDARAEFGLQLMKRLATGVAEDEIKAA